MYKRIIITISFILVSLYGMAQKDINNYKYVIVPKSFEFTNGEDQYQLNSLLKFLFNKHGFEAYFGDENLPEDLKENRCLAMTSNVLKEKGGVFKTKLKITLSNCFGTIVMTSKIGESRLKAYDKAYSEALRGAFETFQNLDYNYIDNQDGVVERSEPKVESVQKETLAVIKAENKVEETPKTVEAVQAKTEAIGNTNNLSDLYYAQEIKNGYQLVNAEPRIVMVLLSTAAENVFIVKGKSAIVYKEDGFWYYSENDGELGEQISMNIKF